uniref:berberine bridge enzyme-like 15 n=1 Tax=Erigeron canadensis TaxID=72917 RepID=UPI001CB88FFF|nr:berberine bridge enzyme-like 15 [Erigeron canadensis]
MTHILPSSFVVLLVLLPSSLAQSSSSSIEIQHTFQQCLSSTIQTHYTTTFYTPNNPNFTTLLNSTAENLRFTTPSTPKPKAIFTPLNKNHIQTAVICAKKLNIQLRFRSGGHDYEGVSYTSVMNLPFIVIDMSKLRAIKVNLEDNSVWVEAGATIGELYYRVAQESKTHGVAAGIFTSLGIGGHITGGAYGSMLRKYGLGVDNALDTVIINAKGKILDRKTMGEDVFWAIRGGGGGSYGVIVSWKLRLVPVPGTVTVFNVPRTLEQGAIKILDKWQQVGHKLDEDLFLRVITTATNITGTTNKRTITTTYNALFLGETDRLLEIMKHSFPELNLHKSDCTEMSWLESVMFMSSFPNNVPTTFLLTGKPAFLFYMKAKSDFVRTPIPETGLKIILEKYLATELDNLPTMLWTPYGGMMERIPESSTPFPHRNGVLFMIQYVNGWATSDNEVMKKQYKWIRDVYEYMGQYVSNDPREAYMNYRDFDLGMNDKNASFETARSSWGRRYYKDDNFMRLVKIKTKFDPDNFFRHEQSIPVLS